MSAFRANKARHNRPDKLKMATSGNASLQGVRRGEGGGRHLSMFLRNFRAVQFASAGEKNRGGEEQEGEGWNVCMNN